ncbi:MAG: ATP-binding protein [Nitrospiraceae bacterium]
MPPVTPFTPATAAAGLAGLLTNPRSRFTLLQSLVGIILSYELLFSQGSVINRGTSDILVIGLLLVIIGVLVLPCRILNSGWFPGVLVGCNTVIVTATIYLSGNGKPELYQAYFLLILIAASVRTLRQMLGLSLVLCLGYSVVLYEGLVETGNLSVGQLLGIPVLLMMAVFYGITLEALTEERQQKASLLTDIEDLKQTETRLQSSRSELERRLVELKAEVTRVNGEVRAGVLERKGLEQQLREAEKMEATGRIAKGMAQEFSHLLTVIGRSTGVILSRLKPNDSLLEPVETIFKTGERAAMLTTQLLSLGESGELQCEILSLDAVVTESQHILRSLLPSNIDLRLELSPGPTLVQINRDQIDQVLLHLVTNARDAMPNGGQLLIQVKPMQREVSTKRPVERVVTKPAVTLMVSDTGGGMNVDTQALVFEPFFSTKEANIGLGLTTVYGIIKRSGGKVAVHSTPGQGTSVIVSLPRADAAPMSAQKAASTALSARGSETVLLVEEDVILRKLALSTLARYKYHVLEAGSAVEALMVSQKYTGAVDLAVSQLLMPDISGKDLAKRLSVQHPRMKALFVSGYSDDTIVHHRINPRCVLQRPYRQQVLVEKVREVLDWN